MADKQKFIQWLSLRGLSETTKKLYTYYFDRFPSQDFTQTKVNEFILEPSFNNLVARAFIKNYIDYLQEEYPLENLYSRIKIPKRTGTKSRKLLEFATLEEINKIEQVMFSEREKIMLWISFYGGLRAQGLINIKASDFAWKDWLINKQIPAKLKVTEKGNKERIVLIPSFIMERLQRWLTTSRIDQNPLNKLWQIGYDRWHDLLTEASKKAIGRQISPHKLRHGCATWLLRNGWSLQEIAEYLGHESIISTQVYAHIDKQKMQDKYAGLFQHQES